MASKYGAVRTLHDGVWYDSKLEAEVAQVLDLLPDRYYIDRQVPFTLVKKSLFGRAITYKADFVIRSAPSAHVKVHIVVEVKGYETAVWKLKKRLFQENHPFMDLRIVRSPDEVLVIVHELKEAAA